MKSPLPMLVWELVWKHRVIFPALILLLGLGGALALATAAYGVRNPWWLGYARGITFFAFLASLLLGYAPFTLMETHSGWRMNSMITRWFTLPVRTPVLVLLPVLAAIALIAGVFSAWAPLLDRVMGPPPGLDRPYFLATLVFGVVLLQAVAWALPRRPGQYWALAGVVLPATLLLALIPQERPDNATWRHNAIPWYLGLSAVLALFAFYAARRNRCGDWPGHLPLERASDLFTARRPARLNFGSARSALFASDTRPALRSLVLSWALMVMAVMGWALIMLHQRGHGGGPSRLDILVYAAVQMLPFVGMLWLAGWGLTLGNQPRSGFRTPLSSFRASLPLDAGDLAGPRLAALGMGWLLVWLPLVLLTCLWVPNLRGIWDYDGVGQIQANLAWRMAVSASLVAGALPVLLFGRLEGFPNLLLTGMCAWAGTWFLTGFLGTKDPGPSHWWMAGILVSLKLLTAASVLIFGLRRRLLTPRFAVTLVTAWVVAFGLVVAVLPASLPEHRWRLLGLLLLTPIVRLATCPFALAANRCR